MEQLINDLKLQIKEALNLEELSLEEFDENAPLFGDEGIGLDSIDVLEIIVLLEKNYGIRLANPKDGLPSSRASRQLPNTYRQTGRSKCPSLPLQRREEQMVNSKSSNRK